MKHFLTFLLAVAVCIPVGFAAVKGDANRPGSKQELFRFMPKVKAPNVFGVKDDADVSAKVKAAAKLASKNLPTADDIGFLYSSDGEPWYYVGQFTKNADGSIEHFAYTIYDSSFEELTKVEDDTELAENETRIVDVQLGSLITNKFFNNDEKPEFVVALAANTTEFVNHYYTQVYSAGGQEHIAKFEGYWCTDVNTSTDIWSENFYVGFMTEQESTTPEIGGLINPMDYVVDIYKKAGYGTSCESVLQLRIPSLLSTGENWIPVLATAHDGNAYFAANYLKYSFYENPMDWNNENLTADNEFLIDYYEIPRYGTPKIVNRNAIPTVGSASNQNFYYIGGFLYDDDITYGRYTEGDTPAFTVTRAHYETSTDGYTYTYEVYPAGSEENPQTEKILTLGENVEGISQMSDVKGYDPQVMMIKNDNGNYTFDFVDLLDGSIDCSLPYVIDDKITMNAGVDRVAGEDSPLYVVSQYTAESDEEGNAIHVIAYVNPDGTLHHADRLNLGQDVAYANVFNKAYALDPYIFNTDADREYMVLVKRYVGDGSKTREEMLVVSQSKGVLLTVLPDEELGAIMLVQLDNKSEYGQNMSVVYQTGDWHYNMVRYELPLTKFAGGDGSVGDPYQIATLGDLRQVKFNPSANYVLANDLDARGCEMEYVTGSFKGSFDGCGHSIIGPELDGQGIFESVVGEASNGGEVKNLNIVEPKVVVADYGLTGILADNAIGANISDVRIYDAVVEGETSEVDATFGGVVGSMALYSKISGSAVIGADINLPESSVGGIAGKIMTSTTVKACSFKGNIKGGTTVGGIVGSTNDAADCIEDCHVNAAITAKNTIGGVAGTSSRGALRRCHVEGSIEATEAPMWGGGASTGGLIGSLETDWSGNAGDATIKGNFINLSSLKAFEPNGEPYYEGEYDTFHRVVGASCANEEPAPIYDDQWNVIGYEDAMVETILGDNYVADNLAKGNEAIADETTTTEGKAVLADELGREFFEGLGYAFGYEIDSPWSEMSAKAPWLYFETGLILFDHETYYMAVDGEADLVINIFGEEIDEDAIAGFTVDIADESVIEYANLSVVDGKIVFTVKALKEGTTTVSANYNGQTANATVIVDNKSGIEAVETSLSIDYSGGVVKAEGCRIEVYGTTGVKVLEGTDSCDLGMLGNGVYVVVATDKSGRRSSLKVMR